MPTSVAVMLGSSLRSRLRHYRLALEPAGYHLLEAHTQETGDRSVVALLGPSDGNQLWVWKEYFAQVRPILIGDPDSLPVSQDFSLAVAPVLSSEASSDALQRMVAFLGRDRGWLLSELLRIDHTAKHLVEDAHCEWVRSRAALVGIVLLGRLRTVEDLTNILTRLIDHAHSMLDRLPLEKLSLADIWNVTLLVAVPINESELDGDSPIIKSLKGIPRDLRGSRKLVLWFDQKVTDYFGPLGQGPNVWRISSDDPLRETLDHIATDPVERTALELVFKRRFSQEDIDQLMQVLGRSYDQQHHN